MNLNELNFFQRIIVKHLAGGKFLPSVVNLVASQMAAFLISLVADSPTWLQAFLATLSEYTSIPFNEASLTVIIGFLVSSGIQIYASNINGKGAEKIQELVNEERDRWVGNKTIEGVVSLKAAMLEQAREANAFKEALLKKERELRELKESLNNPE